MTKKAAALLLAASLAVSVCATPVFAVNAPVTNDPNVQDEVTGENIADPATGKKACMQLKYNVTEGYTWSIPSDIEFDADHGVTEDDMTKGGRVTVKNCKLKNGYTLKITMTGNGGQYDDNDGGFKVKTAEGATLDYTVQKGTAPGLTDVESGREILTIAAGTDNEASDLTFTLKTHNDQGNYAETAGEYIGYAIFTAQATK